MSKPEKKALVPTLRFPEFRDADAWINKQLCEVADVNASGDLDSENFSPTKTDEHIYPIYSNSVSQEGLYGYCAYPKYQKDSVTITARGTLGIAFYRDHDYVGIGRLLVLGNLKNVVPYFLQEIWNYSAKIPLENGGIPQLTAIKARAVELYMPEKEEQQKIADCLTSVDELITTQTQKLDALKTHKKGLMQQLFPAEGETVPKRRFPEFGDKGEWSVKPLGKVAENLDSKRIPITEADRVKGYVPYYGASGVIDYVEGYIFDEDLLCISEDGANLVARTYPIAFSISGKTWVNNHAHVLKFKYRFTQTIVENYLNAKNLEDFLTGMAQPKLNQAKLEIIPIPLPDDEDEQQKIADCLASIDDLISTQTQKLDTLKTHKKGLMQQLFPAMDEVSA